jgi:hypothetical protein
MRLVARAAAAVIALDLAACGGALPGPTAAERDGSSATFALTAWSDADRAFVAREIAAGRVVFVRVDGPGYALVRGCEARAAWARDTWDRLPGDALSSALDRDGAHADVASTGVRRVAALATNERGACAFATHVVTAVESGGVTVSGFDDDGRPREIARFGCPTCDEPLVASVAPIAEDGTLFRAARRLTYASALGGSWKVDDLCSTPCEAWVLPGTAVTLHEAPPGDRSVSAWAPDGDAPSTTVCTRRRRELPAALAGWMVGVGVAGAVLATVATVSIANGEGTTPGGSGSSQIASNAGTSAAGLVVMPILGAASLAIAGFGVYELFPHDVVVAEPACAPAR